MISVVNKRMVFKFTVPATYNGEPTDYAISTKGRVYNMKTGRLRKLRSRPDGRHDVNLSFGSKDNCRTFTVYRMVAETFLEGQDIDSLETNSVGTEVEITIDFVKDQAGYDAYNE